MAGAASATGVQGAPSTLVRSSYEATPRPTSVAPHEIVIDAVVRAIEPEVNRARGALATGGTLSGMTVTVAAPVTPAAVAATVPVPIVVACRRPEASSVPIAPSSAQAIDAVGIGTGLIAASTPFAV